jgi:hypothetical protein
VPAGDAERVSATLHARTTHLAFVDRLLEGEVGPVLGAHVPNRGEAGHERALRMHDGEHRAERIEVLHALEVVARVAEDAAADVSVRVDEPRKERRIAEVDRLCARGHGDGATAPDCGDAISRHDHNAIGDRCRAGAVNDMRRAQDDWSGWGLWRLLLRRQCARERDRGERGRQQRGEAHDQGSGREVRRAITAVVKRSRERRGVA